MATDFTQDTVLHFLQSSGGSVKNSDLLLHFRDFIRNHADQERNRELFKKFVNSVATVRQEDGVSYVVLRKKFRGNVPGDGAGASSGPPRCPAERNPESSPGSTNPDSAVSAEKQPRVKPLFKEVTAPAPPGETAKKTVLPSAGIIINNNNNVETNFNLKQQQQVNSTPAFSGRPAAAQIPERPELKTPSLPEPPARDQCIRVGQQTVSFGPPPGITPVVPAVRHHGETNQQVPVPQSLRGREAYLQPEGGLHHQEPPLPQVSLPPQGAPRQFRHRKSYKSAVSFDEDEEEEEEVPARRGSAGGAWPLSASLGDTTRAISTSSSCIVDPPPPPKVSLPPQGAPRQFRHRKSYKSAVSCDEDEEEVSRRCPAAGGGGAVWPTGAVSASSLPPPSVVSSSSSSSSERNLPKIYIQDVGGRVLPSLHPGCSSESGMGLRGQWAGLEPAESTSTRHGCPLAPSPDRAKEASPLRDIHQDRRHLQASGVQPEPGQVPHQGQRSWMSSSHSSIFTPSSDAGFSSGDWPQSGSSGLGWNSSHEDLQTRTDETGRAVKIQEVLQRAQGPKLGSLTHLADSETAAGRLHDNRRVTTHLSPFHNSTDDLHDDQASTGRVQWHLSTGDLYDDREDAESSEGSTSSLRQHPAVVRRFSSQLRSRMCRSLGADLDQLLQEEARGGGAGGSEAARLNRLHLISSTLSLRHNLSSSSLSSCSTPPRCQSLANLVEGPERGGGGRRHSAAATASSTAHHEGSNKQSLVPLEPREHTWLVKGAAGAWPDIYSLFREDSSLLNKRDFISGFTVLHWIAKHGDHRVLNTLWYGVEKAGLKFDINARSACGHTPLHIAAIHGNKNIMRLLVNKFSADVRLRDTAGKRPWQYLSHTAPVEVFHLLGAPARAAMGGDGGVRRVDTSWEQQQQQQQQRRRRRHHLSSASGERPLIVTGTMRVKRSSSIAAFLKHKSLQRFYGHQSDSSV
ncbi:ankyrin repeat domain-containing protein SOWAHB-like [Lates japonicus]